MADTQPLDVGGAAEKILSLMEPPPEEQVEPEAQTSEQVEETEGAQETASDDSEQESEQQAESESTEEDEDIQTFDELADHLGVDIDYLKKLKVRTKADGVEKEATIERLLTEFQIDQNATRKSQELAESRKAFEAESQAQKEQLQGQLNQAAQLTQFLESELTKDVEAIDWNTLRQEDPAEFAAKKQEVAERVSQLQQIKQGTSNLSRQSLIEAGRKEMEANIKRLPEVISEWSDTEVQKKEMPELREYLLSNYSFNPEQIDGKVVDGQIESYGLINADTIAIARKAMLYDRLMKESKPKKEKLKKLPKLGAGKPRAKDEINTEARKAKRARLKKTGRVEDAESVLKEMFGG